MITLTNLSYEQETITADLNIKGKAVATAHFDGTESYVTHKDPNASSQQTQELVKKLEVYYHKAFQGKVSLSHHLERLFDTAIFEDMSTVVVLDE